MAGDQIYIGEMLKAVNTKLDSVMTAIDAQVGMLTAVSQNTGQTITQLNCKPGTAKEFIISETELKTTAANFAAIKTIVSNATGSVKISGQIKVQNTSYGGALAWSIDGANWTQIASSSSTTYANFEATVPVVKGNVYIGGKCTAPYNVSLSPNSKLTYDVETLLNTGPFV